MESAAFRPQLSYGLSFFVCSLPHSSARSDEQVSTTSRGKPPRTSDDVLLGRFGGNDIMRWVGWWTQTTAGGRGAAGVVRRGLQLLAKKNTH
ncbi:unnamed protein product [Pleuronectes platessa]|uniref:Uncharacterized protein n=1 Tax=Pleuronectes platessa TaxID=8262 RepID=A0A9N7Z0X2_PLEPL|nr:unnamed protein product [Pleuronectes platessa]